jgi:hypothetical protein
MDVLGCVCVVVYGGLLFLRHIDSWATSSTPGRRAAPLPGGFATVIG